MLKAFHTARDSLKNLLIESEHVAADGLSNSVFTDLLSKTTDMIKARDELMSLPIAAHDSDASLLCWLIYTLARKPAVFAKLQQEILSVLGPDPDFLPEDAHLSKLRYLDYVINETLRLFQVVPLNGRLRSETTTLPVGGGKSGEEPIFVPKGTLICLSTFACQRSSSYFGGDAMKFRPERWQDVDARVRIRNFTFHPFIGGPRKCLGGE